MKFCSYMGKSPPSLWPLIAIFLATLPVQAFAHQPNYVGNRIKITDTEPSISRAYYGELTGQEAEYKLVAQSSFELYLNVLSPYKAEAFRDFSVVVKDGKGTIIGMLNNPSVGWTRWYEEYAGDWYWQGPELRMRLSTGTYTITVQNSSRSGKYVLATGEDEAFPLGEMLHTLKELYLVKTKFFEEPWYSIYGGVVGRYLIYTSFVVLLIAAMIVWIVVRLVRKRVKSRQIAA